MFPSSVPVHCCALSEHLTSATTRVPSPPNPSTKQKPLCGETPLSPQLPLRMPWRAEMWTVQTRAARGNVKTGPPCVLSRPGQLARCALAAATCAACAWAACACATCATYVNEIYHQHKTHNPKHQNCEANAHAQRAAAKILTCFIVQYSHR